MKKITVAFSNELVTVLEEYKKEGGFDSLAEALRAVVNVWVNEKQSVPIPTAKISSAPTGISMPEPVLEKTLSWLGETRLLLRYLVETNPGQSKAVNVELLKHFKEESEGFVK